jgi:hypothetical protein
VGPVPTYRGGRQGKLVWVGPHQTLTLNADQYFRLARHRAPAARDARLLVEQASAGAAAQLATRPW